MADHDPTPISRQEARADGLRRYFTGKPCKHGHVAERFTSCGQCLRCNVTNVGRYAAEHPEWESERKKRRKARHRERYRHRDAAYHAANRDKINARHSAHYYAERERKAYERSLRGIATWPGIP